MSLIVTPEEGRRQGFVDGSRPGGPGIRPFGFRRQLPARADWRGYDSVLTAAAGRITVGLLVEARGLVFLACSPSLAMRGLP